ncbi:Methionyl-tRNA formyltransferase [Gnomoniopsis smithogilvyi]|uniref:methionyl-tRNA formyltransferase n=1 Tax=Gnomoniopsis smithogilvyi TaxID=1191159 RepID=A0A9W8YZJ5_9PEZI|nr:Methionyl-tRNA formyltransferase [Gnomoniopsis smithogilvyi]
MPPSILRTATLYNNTWRPTALPHVTTPTTHFPSRYCPNARHIVTTETAPKINLNIRPLPPKTSDPLRILFCGSDHFSCASLSALHNLHKAEPQLIESIDVLVRPGKKSGRGLKRIAVGPLFHLASELNLPLHQRDTFTGWKLPLPGRVTDNKTGKTTIFPHPNPAVTQRPHHSFNLLIAVSFGLFVPPRILNGLKYGGLNIHPSLLPDLRGPAPIQWALLLNRTHTGCTLQTLHPTSFDRGAILLQTPLPGVPIPPDSTTNDLLTTLATEGANMLVQGLRNNLHVPPLEPLPPPPAISALGAPFERRDAPKITKVDLAIDWSSELWGRDQKIFPNGQWTASDLARRYRAVGGAGGAGGTSTRPRGLWAYAFTVSQPIEQRLIFEDIEAVPCPPALREAVATIVKIKLAGGDGRDAAPPSFPADVGNVVFGYQPDAAVPEQQFRVPMMVEEEGTSVVMPIRVPYRVVDGVVEVVDGDDDAAGGECNAVRVRRVKVEGQASEEASRALKPFWEKNVIAEDVAVLEYAVDVIAKRVD